MNRIFQRLTLSQIILAGCLVTLLYAALSRGAYHSDEHYQILEYAHMKLFGTPTPEELPWEYGLQMRPGIQPLIAYGLGWTLDLLGIYSPVLLVFLLQLLSGAFSVGVMLFFFRTVRDELGEIRWQKWFLILGFFLWFMAFLHVHFNAEMLAGNLLLLLLGLYLKQRHDGPKRPFAQGLLLGAVAGSLFVVRFQMGFALAGFALWLLVYDRRWKFIGGAMLSAVAMLGIGMLADRWLYGAWTLTPVNYLRENILNSHMDSFGVDPWYHYLIAILGEGGFLFGLLVLAATIYFGLKNPRHIITWTLLPFLAVHLLIGHKELRFLFPAVFLAPYFLVYMFRRIPPQMLQKKASRILLAALGVVNILLIVYALGVHDPNMHFYDSMRRYCREKQAVVALNLKSERTYYSFLENIIGKREVVSAFYRPANLSRRSFDDLIHLEDAAQKSTEENGVDVLILSEHPHLADSLSLPLEKLPWNPFPRWVVRYFNFNDWTSRSIRKANVYRVTPPSPTQAAD